MSNSTKKRTQRAKKHKTVNRTATRKAAPCRASSQELPLDDESKSVMAAFEWMGYDQNSRDYLMGLGVANQDAYIDVRVGMKHKSGEEFMEWAYLFRVGYVRVPADLELLIDCQLQALSVAVRLEKYNSGIDLIAEARRLTSRQKIQNTIRSRDLPSGAKYYFSPYELGSKEYMVWLLKYSKKFEKPWKGRPFG